MAATQISTRLCRVRAFFFGAETGRSPHVKSLADASLAPELQKSIHQVLYPFLGLIAVIIAALVFLELWSAREGNKLAAKASRELAQAGFQVALSDVGSNVTATAIWDDATEHMHKRYDQEWAVANIGNWATDTLHFEMTFVVDPDGATRFAMIDGQQAFVPIGSVLGAGLNGLLARARATPLGEAVVGVVKSGDRVVMVGAATIRPHTDKLPPIAGGFSILVYGDVLDAAAIAKLQRAYLLNDLKLVQSPAGTGGELPLLQADGSPAGYLVWQPDRPGTHLLGIVLPVLGALTIAISVVAAFILLHAKRTAAALSLSRHLAQTDSLTGLPNRRRLEDCLGEALRAQKKSLSTVAVICLDLDRFKRVNDLWGHAAGDELLRQAADRLRTVLRSADIVARVGGDEFVVVVTAHNRQSVEQLVERLLLALKEPVFLNDVRVPIETSIGISFADEPDELGSDLIRRADMALYDAKRTGGNHYHIAPGEKSNGANTQARPSMNQRSRTAPLTTAVDADA